MAKLGVNVDHIATVRQARGGTEPDPVTAAAMAELAGADGITVHLREDRRHIQDRDVMLLRRTVQTHLNLEMASTDEMVAIAMKVVPDYVTLVPEKRQELTTEGGLDVAGQQGKVEATVKQLTDAGILVSLFIAPDPAQLEASVAVGAPVVELHTGAFCDGRGAAAQQELDRLIEAARIGHGLGLQVNAGHGINLANFDQILRIPHLEL